MVFDQEGRHNTQETISLALSAARERGIRHIVVPSNTGETASLLQNTGLNVICVTHASGFKQKGQNEMSAEARALLEANGVRVYTATHVLSGVERGISRFGGGMYPAELIAQALRMLGQGLKVCVETATMAFDGGLLPADEKIIAIGGTGRGADTAVVMTPAHASAIFETRIHEVLCKPQ